MLKVNKSINISGQSYIEVTDGTGKVQKQVAYLSANVQENDKSANINKSIQDMDLFNTNKTAILADFQEFENTVYDLLSE